MVNYKRRYLITYQRHFLYLRKANILVSEMGLSSDLLYLQFKPKNEKGKRDKGKKGIVSKPFLNGRYHIKTR